MDRFWDWGILLLYVAIVFLLVRPKSKGPDLVTGIGNTAVRLVQTVTGGGSWSG